MLRSNPRLLSGLLSIYEANLFHGDLYPGNICLQAQKDTMRKATRNLNLRLASRASDTRIINAWLLVCIGCWADRQVFC